MNSNRPRGHRQTLMTITFSGVFAALILLATQLKIPTGIGYANLGDGLILISAYVLGPIAFFPAAIGSALADLLAGYAVYIPATFVIKGLMGLVAGLILKQEIITLPRKLVAFGAAELIMILGYFIFEIFLYGFGPAVGSLLPNVGQAVVGIILALALVPPLDRFRRQRMSHR